MSEQVSPFGKYNQVQLNWLVFRSRVPLSPGVFLSDPQIADYVYGEGIAVLEAHVLGRKRPSKVVEESNVTFFKMPASPFQHYKHKHKDAWWMRWFVKKRPVIYTEYGRESKLSVSWDMSDVYPEQTKISYLDNSHPVVVIEEPVVGTQWFKDI